MSSSRVTYAFIYHNTLVMSKSYQYLVNISALVHRSELRFVSLERALNSASMYINTILQKLFLKKFSNTNFFNNIILYDFSNNFQWYRDVLQGVAVDLSISVDSPSRKLSIDILAIVQTFWPFFFKDIYCNRLTHFLHFVSNTKSFYFIST